MSRKNESLRALDDYLSGVLPEAAAARFEDDLFERAALGSAPEAEFVDQLVALGRTLQGRAGLELGASPSRIEALRAEGFRVDVADARPGVNQPAAWSPDADIVVTHYLFDLRGYTKIDVDVEAPDGTRLKTFRDVSYNPSDGTVYAMCEARLARLAETVHARLRVHGTRDGERREIVVFETLPAR